ncbi:hypothetical protein [Streptomonospora salina]|uniref:Uncharacterized protein n=1 Tax=Streptomonospora salina TaxID=104205 RepID=A0A841E803_9ACTN|nr:hypothetical protein [Streptomonospora salina]MBB5999022.1 hypothetical protein [Streptomonospora salina]
MSAQRWACRLCTRPNTGTVCGFCGNPLSEQWRLPPLTAERGRSRRDRTARVRPYVRAFTGEP